MNKAPEPELHYCSVQTYAGSYYVDPQPPEYCESVVDEEGQLCDEHEAAQTREDERDDYDRYRESKYE